MKILCYTDLQADDGNERCFSDPNKPLQLYRVELFFRRMAEIAREHQVDGVWDLGDTTDNQTNLSLPTIQSTLNGLDLLNAVLPDTHHNIKLIGNHDYYLKDASVNNGALFSKRFEYVVDKFQILRFPGIAVVCIAYPGYFSQDLVGKIYESTSGLSGNIICLIHAEIVGASMPSAIVAKGFPLDLFKKFNLTLAGHIHRPQSLEKLGVNVHYIGSPFQQDFGEANERKRVAIINTDTCSVQWIPLDGFPEYKNVTLSQFESSHKNTENRMRVMLGDESESTRFFANPEAARASPDFSFLKQKQGDIKSDFNALNLESAMGLWVVRNKLNGYTSAELIDSGKKMLTA